MDATAKAHFQRCGPRKVNQVCTVIRGKSVALAQAALPTARRTAKTLVEKTLRSAAANLAVRLGHPVFLGKIYIKSAWVGQGPMRPLRRIRPAPMGRAMTFKRKMCHLTVIVTDTLNGKA